MSGTCVNGTDYPAWMIETEEYKHLYIFHEAQGKKCEFSARIEIVWPLPFFKTMNQPFSPISTHTKIAVNFGLQITVLIPGVYQMSSRVSMRVRQPSTRMQLQQC